MAKLTRHELSESCGRNLHWRQATISPLSISEGELQFKTVKKKHAHYSLFGHKIINGFWNDEENEAGSRTNGNPSPLLERSFPSSGCDEIACRKGVSSALSQYVLTGAAKGIAQASFSNVKWDSCSEPCRLDVILWPPKRPLPYPVWGAATRHLLELSSDKDFEDLISRMTLCIRDQLETHCYNTIGSFAAYVFSLKSNYASLHPHHPAGFTSVSSNRGIMGNHWKNSIASTSRPSQPIIIVALV